MASVNKVTLIGHLGNDPDVRTMPSGDIVATISIATTDRWKDKQSGETREHTDWHRVQFWGRLAEIVDQYLRKGSMIYVEGSLRNNKWTDKDGIDRYSTDIRADNMQMLKDPQNNGDRGDNRGGYDDRGGRGQGGGYRNNDRGGRGQGNNQRGGGRGGYSNQRGGNDRGGYNDRGGDGRGQQRQDDRQDYDRGQGGGQDRGGYAPRAEGNQGQGQARGPAPAPQPARQQTQGGGSSGFDDMDDDIPF